MRVLPVFVLLLLLSSTLVEALPSGVGEVANRGCLCHGGESAEVEILVNGFPEVYNSSETYNISFTIDAVIERAEDDSGREGGFRLLINGGEVDFEDESQYLEGGWTHTNESNKQRNWSLTWVAPEQDNQLVSIKLFANAVNGGDAAGGDKWGAVELSVVGPNWTGEIQESSSRIGLTAFEIAGAIGSLSILLYLLVLVNRD
tara:strand:+ start:152 stop:757 length:606 start_codon:yes stop_codon:yes gene_type:complete